MRLGLGLTLIPWAALSYAINAAGTPHITVLTIASWVGSLELSD